jgi:hypothetical protein
MTELQKYLRKAHTKLCCASVTAWILLFSFFYEIKQRLTIWERFFSLRTLHFLLVIMIIGFSLFAFHDCGEAMKEEKSRTEKD